MWFTYSIKNLILLLWRCLTVISLRLKLVRHKKNLRPCPLYAMSPRYSGRIYSKDFPQLVHTSSTSILDTTSGQFLNRDHIGTFTSLALTANLASLVVKALAMTICLSMKSRWHRTKSLEEDIYGHKCNR